MAAERQASPPAFAFGEMNAVNDDPAVLAFWDRVYRQAFSDLLWHKACPGDTEGQRRGVDRLLYFPNDRVLRVDEKTDRHAPDRILLEYISNDTTGAKGWVEKPLAIDYVAYGFVQHDVAYLLPWDLLRGLWLRRRDQYKHAVSDARYGIVASVAQNNGYRTLGVCVPTEVILAGLNSQMVVRL